MALASKIIIPLIFVVSFKACRSKSNTQCGNVSARVMYTMVSRKLENLKEKSVRSDKNAQNLKEVISKLNDFNSDLVLLAGGFKEGKSLEISDPCKEVSTKVKTFPLEKSYNELVSLFVLNGLINNDKAESMKFIINSYFCESCAFSEPVLQNSQVGIFLLENLTLQASLIEMI